MSLSVIILTILTIGQCFAENCTINSLYNTTCPLEGLILQRIDLNVTISKDNCDDIFKKEDFAVKPIVKYPAGQSEKLYTMIMGDPDAVNTKPETYVLHWMVSNIKGNDFANGDFKDALTVKEYHPPSPPINSGIHRYQFLVYTQDQKIFGQVLHENRANFLLETWLESTAQTVCGPVAGIQFRVKAPCNSDNS